MRCYIFPAHKTRRIFCDPAPGLGFLNVCNMFMELFTTMKFSVWTFWERKPCRWCFLVPLRLFSDSVKILPKTSWLTFQHMKILFWEWIWLYFLIRNSSCIFWSFFKTNKIGTKSATQRACSLKPCNKFSRLWCCLLFYILDKMVGKRILAECKFADLFSAY